MKRIGQFLLENQNFLQDIKMNVSYTDPNLSSNLRNGYFEITVKILSKLPSSKIHVLKYLKASRATFQHKALDNATIRNNAMDSVKGAMNDVQFGDSDFHSPIPYTAMYVQWEANKVIGQLYFLYSVSN